MNLLCLSFLSLLLSAAGAPYTKTFDVRSYGAVPDGKTDSTKAFQEAWEDACGWEGLKPQVVIPLGKFLVGPLVFQGPCKGSLTVVQVNGYVLAQEDLNAYKTRDWITFRYINGLLVTGKGTFDGQGASAWPYNNCRRNKKCRPLPWSLNFSFVSSATIKGITSLNSKNVHIQVFASSGLTFKFINLIAPGDSPNTDGIHVGESRDITVFHSIISTGDDCVSVGPGTKNLSVLQVWCGPGHGISIGSLGGGENERDVFEVNVKNCTFTETTNGVRIKTWQSSPTTSSAYKFTFDDLVMNNVENPIIIDQQYCPNNQCNKQAPSLVKISNVKFSNIRGESRTKDAINLDCSAKYPCEDIELSNIDLKYTVAGDAAVSSCVNVRGHSFGTINPPSCI